MNTIIQKLSNPTMIPCIISAIKLILQPFGVVIPDAELNMFMNGICALVTIIGICINHDKVAQKISPTTAASPQALPDAQITPTPVTAALPNQPTFTAPSAP